MSASWISWYRGAAILSFAGRFTHSCTISKGAAALREVAAVELLVHQARGRGHPLHVAGADLAAASGGVAVLDLTFVDDRHRLEPAVRVLADAAPLASVGANSAGPA